MGPSRGREEAVARGRLARLAVSADLLLLVVVVLWAFNFTAIRYAVSHGFEPLAYASLRWGIAALAFSLVTWRLEGSLRVARRDFLLLAALAACGLWLNQAAVTYAVQLSSAATVALIFGILPAFVALVSRMSGVQRLRTREWAGIGVSFTGVVLIAVGAEDRLSSHAGGIILAVLTAASFAVYSVGVVPLMGRYSPYRISAVTALIGSVLLGLSGSWQLARQSWDVGALAWAATLYGGLAAAGLGNLLWFKLMDRVGPGRAAVYLHLQPFLGALFAVLVISETLKPAQIVGGAIIGAGIALARVRQRPSPAAE